MEAEKILSVDTEKNILLTYKTVLEDEGYQADIALSEQEALRKLTQNNYSVIITEFYLKSSTTLNLINYVQKTKPEMIS